MSRPFDPRLWNLFAGAALVTAGCDTRPATHDDGDTSGAADDGATDGGDDPECSNSNDCPTDYLCDAGVCVYVPQHIPYYECYQDWECEGQYAICKSNYCGSLSAPPPDCPDQGLGVPLDVHGGGLALAFVDSDGDGDEELALATDDALYLYGPDGTELFARQRTPGWINAMVAVDFDPALGEDLLLLVEDQLTLHPSDGVGGLGPGVSEPAPMASLSGLVVANTDDQPPLDLYGWGLEGMFILRSGELFSFPGEPINTVVVFDVGQGAAEYLVKRDSGFVVYDSTDQEIGDAQHLADAQTRPVGLTGPKGNSVVHVGRTDNDYARAQQYAESNGWYSESEWAIPLRPRRTLAGDLDGIDGDDLIYVDDHALAIEYGPDGASSCLAKPVLSATGSWERAAVGDIDGDGDDELALLSKLGEVLLVE